MNLKLSFRSRISPNHLQLIGVLLMLGPFGWTSHSIAEISLKNVIDSAYEQQQINAQVVHEENISIARIKHARSFPNPRVFWEEERLSGNNFGDSKETKIGISTSLDFLWNRVSQIEAAELRQEVALYDIELKRVGIAEQVVQSLMRMCIEKKRLDSLERVNRYLDDFYQAVSASIEAGAVPSTSLKMVEITQDRYRSLMLESKLSLKNAHIAITHQTGSSDWNIESLEITDSGFPFLDVESAVAYAKSHHPEIRKAKSQLEWLRAESRSANRKKLPKASLDVGGLQNESGQDGSYIGLSVDLPFFAKTGSLAEIAKVEAEKVETELKRIALIFESAVKQVYRAWQVHSERWENRPSEAKYEELVENSSNLFLAGEYTLLEHLGTIESYYQGIDSILNRESKFLESTIRLATETGAEIPLIIIEQ
ncbi:MAG: TolC family protein [Opitutales bacterium]|nr:TolC family protein [Opitutales bacterium]